MRGEAVKRVLFIGNDVTYFLTHRLPMALGAREAGYEVHVAAPRADGVERIVAQGFQYHHIQLSRWGGHPMREFRSLCSIYRVLREVKPDLVHQVTIKPVIYGGLMARLAGRPAIVSAVSGLGFVFLQRGLLGGIVRNAARLAYKLAFAHRRIRVIFQNPDDRAEFIARGLVNAKKTVLIKGSGVNVKIFAASPEPQGAVTVVFPSRMLWDKGLREFVDAAGKLRSEGITARFALVGNEEPGNPASASTSQLQQWHDSGVVEWWGYRGDMSAVFAGAHLVCLPSYREGVPKALIEAAACGRAIVTTDVPGCREIVRDGWNGLLAPARDANALADALRSLIADAEKRAEFGERGRELAVAEFSVERVVQETLEVYRDLLQ